ncbi:50S ribosomal protein L23 [Bacteroidetes bacterium endosymbiont of Geopemphigus sp.]|uniref:50S ribosomal protein L23 n=1 Tax=Bacteroidetes bacterium endosymbiont of Geopemphigus sp. TaxID=2047937 RepID=UPI000CD1B7A0|nr:50S ribosomal protein L23 [Bacteroidetes bacterium endosymbiont of Geopemphigus sp.]
MRLLIEPIITEKANSASELRNVYTFVVSRQFNKVEIKKSIQARYGVSVKNVRTIIYAPKTMRRNTKSGVVWGKSNKTKRALVELREGQSIDFYGNI